MYLGTAKSNSLQLFAQGSCQWDWAQGQRHRLKLDLEGKREFLPMGVSSLQRWLHKRQRHTYAFFIHGYHRKWYPNRNLAAMLGPTQPPRGRGSTRCEPQWVGIQDQSNSMQCRDLCQRKVRQRPFEGLRSFPLRAARGRHWIYQGDGEAGGSKDTEGWFWSSSSSQKMTN